jgi:hypothetical protein
VTTTVAVTTSGRTTVPKAGKNFEITPLTKYLQLPKLRAKSQRAPTQAVVPSPARR